MQPIKRHGTSREQIFDSIFLRQAVGERPPTVRDLAKELKLAPSTVYVHLQNLEKAGRIEKVAGEARSVRIPSLEVVR